MFTTMEMISRDNDQETSSAHDYTTTPLKKYVTIVGDKRDNKWICNFGCRVDAYTGSYSRIRAHLIGVKKGEKTPGIILCSKLSPDDRESLRKEEEDARDISGGVLRKRKKLDNPPPQSLVVGKRSNPNVVKDMFKVSARDDADSRIARFFYSCGIPFSVARSPLWIDAVKAINEAPRNYGGPSSEKIKTILLDKEKTIVDNRLSILKRDWAQYGVSIIAIGWSNVRKEPLVNIFAVCGGKPTFLTAIDSLGVEKNGNEIAEILLKVIETVGKYNVLQILTDNDPKCKVAGDIIMEKLPHIFWSGSMSHMLSLLMKDVARSSQPSLIFVGVCYQKVKEIVNYIRNHSLVLHIFQKFPSLKVIQVKKPRFGYQYVIIERLYKLKDSLIDMVSNDEWELIIKGTSKSMLSHDEVKRVILDEQFWKDVEFVLFFTRPMARLIHFCESDKAVIGEVYKRMEDMLGSIKEALSDHEELSSEVEALVIKRWERMNFPLHALCYVLNPYYYSDTWLQTIGPGKTKRSKPHSDPFVQSVYLTAISKLTSAQDTALVRKQLSDFTCDGGVFARPEAIEDRKNMTPLQWWNLYGVSAPQLYPLAIKVLSQSVNSSFAGRELSSYSFVHNAKINKLNSDRAESLIYVHYNNRILKRYEEDYEKHKNWDRNSYEDFLEDDLEGIEDQELEALESDLL